MDNLSGQDHYLADLPEKLATGDAAAFFVRVRAESGSELVNFVWRHLATLPKGVAEWCWDVVRMNNVTNTAAVLSAQADEEASLLVGSLPTLPYFCAEATEILAAYNSNNAINLARMGVLLNVFDTPALWQGTAQPPQAVLPTGGLRASIPLPSLPSFSTLNSEDTKAIKALSGAGPGSLSGVLPSLWSHLTVQPGLIQAICSPLVNILGKEGFTNAHSVLCATATSRHSPVTSVLPPDFDVDLARASIRCFTERIAELTLAGRVLKIWMASTSQRRLNN